MLETQMNGLKLADGSDQCRGNNPIFWDVILDDRLNEIKQVLHDNHVALKVSCFTWRSYGTFQ